MKFTLAGLLCGVTFVAQVSAQSLPGLSFSDLPKRWDEGIPLGNGMLGALVWQKTGHLRMSLDRADLWDNRQALDMSRLTYKWVQEKWTLNQYDSVQKIGDEPYDVIPYPTKIPAAALEWNIDALGPVSSVLLDTRSAVCRVRWASGTTLETFVGAKSYAGWFRFILTAQAAPSSATAGAGSMPAWSTLLAPILVIPPYHPDSVGANGGPVDGPSLQRLGFAKGTIKREGNSWEYHQPISEGQDFTVHVRWIVKGDTLTGCWTVNRDTQTNGSAMSASGPRLDPSGFGAARTAHLHWWSEFWSQCSLHLPDSVMERQWYMDRYKLGSAARKGAPPITLQAVWTADEGRLPPWKGDVHNDLNTQLSYWPAFSGNYEEGAASFTDWLWSTRAACKKYTRDYFGTDGLNVPGVCTLSGTPMGGWIQYSLGPTVGAWLAEDFDDQWKYWRDPRFLKERAYPYVSSVATYLEQITHLFPDQRGRSLPLSSSPEMFDNSHKAWFPVNTNFDAALILYLFRAASREAKALGKKAEAAHWDSLALQVAPLAVDGSGLSIAPGMPQTESHRHMSPFMSIYPLGLLNPDRQEDKMLMDQTLAHLSALGTRNWVGYSFCWAGCLFARDMQGDSAIAYLKAFATNFCSPNSFHLNGDQKGGQYSGFTYRPFTLEGNFAYEAGVQEALLQSYKGYIEVFPAIPSKWETVSFHGLRAEGGFLVDAALTGTTHVHIHVRATRDGVLLIKVPGLGALNRIMKAGESLDFEGEK